MVGHHYYYVMDSGFKQQPPRGVQLLLLCGFSNIVFTTVEQKDAHTSSASFGSILAWWAVLFYKFRTDNTV